MVSAMKKLKQSKMAKSKWGAIVGLVVRESLSKVVNKMILTWCCVVVHMADF